jgi:aspartyl-tRNA(Asn)/glutamyl-tRNA(Gln) amidotransferase subunit B
MPAWEAVIGLEVHVQLRTRTKLFCRCANRYGAEPNSLVCEVCLGYPGALPVANREAVDLAVRLALALGCEVRERSVFARKNYFYPDLPKGYQISQYDQPLAEGGLLPLAAHERSVRLHRLHLEEDAGKLLHELPGGAPIEGASLVDFNRCGVPLVEIVTEPEIASSAEAEDFLRTLHQVLLYTATSDGSLEEGSLRCDANVSLRPAGSTRLGTKTEVKNLNSFRNVARAIDAEIVRQRELLDRGEPIEQATRGFDADAGETRALRGKEEAQDYRYFPDPDLPPLVLSAARVAAARAALPELPWRKRARFVDELGITAADARELAARPDLADYFERCVAARPGSARTLANWVRNEVLRVLGERGSGIERAIEPGRLAELVALIEAGTVSGSAAKQVLVAVWDGAESPAEAVERLGLGQVLDETRLASWVAEVIGGHPAQAAQFRSGKEAVLGFLVGQVMKRSGGRAAPRRVQELVREALAAVPVPTPRA